MRFRKLHLIAYGKFTDKQLDFLDDTNFHLVYGDNEKGKSTITAASADLLYGIPNQTNYSFKHKNPKLRIAAELQHSDGERLYFKRKKGNKDTMLDERDFPIKHSVLNKFLNIIDRDTYCNLFGLTYESLVQGGEALAKNCKNIGSSLVQATSGINNIDGISDNFDKKCNDLYKGKRGKSVIRELFEEHGKIKEEKEKATLYTHQWKEVENHYNEKKEEILKINSKIEITGKNLSRLNRIKVTLPLINELNLKTMELEEYDNVPLILKETIDKRIEHTKSKESMNKELTAIENSVQDLLDEINKMNFNEEILNYEKEIEDLQKTIEIYQLKTKEFGELSIQIKTLDLEIKRHLNGMGINDYQDEFLMNMRIDEITKEQIKTLTEEHSELSNNIKVHKSSLIELDEELDNLMRQEEELGESPDISDLEIVIENAQKKAYEIANMEALKNEYENLKENIENSFKLLTLWEGSKEELSVLKLPLKTTVLNYKNRFKELQDEIRNTNLRLEEKIKSLKLEEQKLEKIETLKSVVTEEQLVDIRRIRDTQWDTIYGIFAPVVYEGRRLDAKTELAINEIKSSIEVFPKHLMKSDEAADSMIKNQKELAERKSIKERIQQIDSEIQDARLEINGLGVIQSALLEEWESEWIDIGIISPLSPEEMIEWVENLESIRESLFKENKLSTEIDILETKTTNEKKRVFGELAKLEVTRINDQDSLEELIRKANKILGELKQRQNQLDYVNKEKSKKESSKRVKIKLLKDEEKQLQKWSELWRLSMTAIGKDTLSCSEAKKYLEMNEKLFDYVDKRNDQQIKMESAKKYVEIFETKTKELTLKLNIFMTVKDDPTVIEDLNKYLLEERRNKQIKELKLKELEKNQDKAKKLKHEYDFELECLQKILDRYMCNNINEMEQIETLSVKKSQISERVEALKNDILRIGQGKTIEELVVEAQGQDMDEVIIEIEKLDLERRHNEIDREELFKEYGVIEKEYNDIVNGNSTIAAETAQGENEVFTRITESTTDYFKNLLASKLLKKAVEKYRQDNEYQIITRASEIFKEITGGSFKGIQIQYDEQDNPYIAGIRNDEEETTVSLEGMSKGTIDQLYLTLRIAGIEKYIKNSEPIPLIFDDIVINFDDQRSKKTLEILWNLSKDVQVIYLTHHNRVVEIAQELVSDKMMQIHRLD